MTTPAARGDSFVPPAADSWDRAAQGGWSLALFDTLATSRGTAVQDDVPIGKPVWFEIVRDLPPSPDTLPTTTSRIRR